MTPEQVFEAMNAEMVNRVADAIAETIGYTEGTGSAAIAAIQAMREPTNLMLEAGMDYDERELNIRLGRAPTVEECQAGEWAAMIDAALKG
jgi:hypothetical protein